MRCFWSFNNIHDCFCAIHEIYYDTSNQVFTFWNIPFLSMPHLTWYFNTILHFWTSSTKTLTLTLFQSTALHKETWTKWSPHSFINQYIHHPRFKKWVFPVVMRTYSTIITHLLEKRSLIKFRNKQPIMRNSNNPIHNNSITWQTH